MDYEEEQVILIGGDLDGAIGKFVSLADSYFPSSLKFFKEIVSADIMAEDEEGWRPKEYSIDVPSKAFALVHSPYRLESTDGGQLTLHNPPRLLEVRLTNGDVHYFPFSGSDEFDTRYELENEYTDLFDEQYKEIHILREAAEVMKLLDFLEEAIMDLDVDDDSNFSLNEELQRKFPTFHLLDFFTGNTNDVHASFDSADDELTEFLEDDETRLQSFLDAMKWLGKRNREVYEARKQEFYRYIEEKGISDF